MSSARFLKNALDEIETFPWIVGSSWTSADGPGKFGRETEYPSRFHYHDLDITFYTEINISPALFLHLRLLAQVVGEFYEGKRREQTLKQNAYMQAVHETGARLTHDMKNLLQSLYALTAAGIAQNENNRRKKTEYEAMLERQLPQLAKRLQSTLDKLQNPALGGESVLLPALDWWRDFTGRYVDSGIIFEVGGSLTGLIPATMFDSILENCLENARKKREATPEIQIVVTLTVDPVPLLCITDSGSAIPVGAVDSLFRAPVPTSRRGGFGIGLYQASRQAEQAGYQLRLAENVAGHVRFELSPKSPR